MLRVHVCVGRRAWPPTGPCLVTSCHPAGGLAGTESGTAWRFPFPAAPARLTATTYTYAYTGASWLCFYQPTIVAPSQCRRRRPRSVRVVHISPPILIFALPAGCVARRDHTASTRAHLLWSGPPPMAVLHPGRTQPPVTLLSASCPLSPHVGCSLHRTFEFARVEYARN